MTFIEIKEAILVGIFLSFMVGPVFFMLLKTSILRGVRAALLFDLGVIASDILFIAFAYYGSRPLLLQIKDDPKLYYLGGIILISYGIYSYLSYKKNTEDIDLLPYHKGQKNAN